MQINNEPESDKSDVNHLMAYLALVISVLGISIAPSLMLFSEVDPNSTLMQRMVMASLVIMFVPVGQSEENVTSRRNATESSNRPSNVYLYLLLFLSCILGALDLFARHWVVLYSSLASSALLMNTTPLFLMIIVCIQEKRRLTRLECISLILATLGSFLFVSQDIELSGSLIGESISIAVAVMYAVYLNVVALCRKYFSSRTVIIYNCLFTAPSILPIVLLYSDPIFPASINGFIIIACLAIGTQILGHGGLIYAQGYISPMLVNISLYFRPIMVSVFAYIFFEQTINGIQALGGALIIFSVAVLGDFKKWVAKKSS